MKKQVVTRLYKMPDATLKQKADEYINLLDRDYTDFADRGYNAAAKTDFVNARDTVDAISSDETLESAKMERTAEKNSARSILEKSMRTIFNMAKNKFGSNTAQYRAFGNAAISDQPDAELARTYKLMATAATNHLGELEAEGLTQDKINMLTAQGVAFDHALNEVAQGITNRDLAAQERVEVLNKLYTLVMKYAGIGQDIYYETDEAKYNDYIIYDTPDGLPPLNPPVEPV